MRHGGDADAAARQHAANDDGLWQFGAVEMGMFTALSRGASRCGGRHRVQDREASRTRRPLIRRCRLDVGDTPLRNCWRSRQHLDAISPIEVIGRLRDGRLFLAATERNRRKQRCVFGGAQHWRPWSRRRRSNVLAPVLLTERLHVLRAGAWRFEIAKVVVSTGVS